MSKDNRPLKDIILEEKRKGNVVVSTFEGLMTAPIDKIVEQDADGLLYDLNRGEGTILTFIDDPKWINDYACALVIRRLKEKLDAKGGDQ